MCWWRLQQQRCVTCGRASAAAKSGAQRQRQRQRQREKACHVRCMAVPAGAVRDAELATAPACVSAAGAATSRRSAASATTVHQQLQQPEACGGVSGTTAWTPKDTVFRSGVCAAHPSARGSRSSAAGGGVFCRCPRTAQRRAAWRSGARPGPARSGGAICACRRQHAWSARAAACCKQRLW